MFDNRLTYHVFHDYNIQFDEKGNSCGTVRKAQWVKEGNEPDEEKAKLEIRHVKIDESGETVLKGYAFSTSEGPHELVEGMVNSGFGDTKKILKGVRKRDDFLEAATTINEDDSEEPILAENGEIFDMRDLLNGFEDESYDEDEEE